MTYTVYEVAIVSSLPSEASTDFKQ